MKHVLYLHGFASGPSSRKARSLGDRLAQAGAKVEVPDLAASDFEHLTLTSQLAVIERVAAGRSVSLVGSSMGGYLAALYTARHPEVDRVVLLAPAFDFARLFSSRLGPRQVDEWRESGSLEVFHFAYNGPRKLAYGLLEDALRYEAWPEFTQPTLLIHGIHDDHVPASYSRQFAATHPNVRLEMVESGHEMLNVLEELAEKTVNFLMRDPVSPGTPPLQP
jgi:pimeloyl-ACP methyl ester carboxylesterase